MGDLEGDLVGPKVGDVVGPKLGDILGVVVGLWEGAKVVHAIPEIHPSSGIVVSNLT
ncbi:MAG: hypothetical protein ACTSUE_05195 [Promethearchaeota archaeon]